RQEFKISGALILAISYERDELGRIVAKNEERPSGITRFEYGYDQAGRLVSERKILADGSVLETQWEYDGNGNRIGETRPNGQVITASYDDQDRLLAYGNMSFVYTNNGELVSKCQNGVCQQFTYDVLGNLRQVVLDNGIPIEYVIDGRNRRVGKKVNGQLVQGFLYDDQLRIVAELDGQNQVVATFVYADGINVPALMTKGGRTYRLIKDHLGSVVLVVDTADGTIIQEMRYDAWGNVIYDSNPGFQPFGFAGGLYDTHTRLTRFGARDYDPQVGRWTAKDPLLFAAEDTNLFAYAWSAAALFSDPDGLTVLACARPGRGFPFSMFYHAYFYDDASKTSCGMSGSGGKGDPTATNERGPKSRSNPKGDECRPIPDTEKDPSKGECVMKCCRERANVGFWQPWPFPQTWETHDCFGLTDLCQIECCICPPVKPPRDRFGRPQ
ncbi:MAG: RHS repeat domain-containing protein, partial [Thermoanaerobaculum sp.]